ncbi:Mu transposase C-terminal domain-containing protein [Acidovorax sp. NCPPB 4044]|uniref:Mu transposase C-terminal domain-containing protein n=1 Tax=Acidovorax sp. NCPPB 4044 TaxID=2940490 RepID=UPI002302C688|nr:Mu transposase C-terminal domain-containing protein [Acidovorax sp. NCPPB 4044]MDA8522953.1 Mu transposase C-terminal domain-containing protein [Acidovorax sp. NCPPB 4044]
MASISRSSKKPTLLHISKGALVRHNDREYVVMRVADLNKVLVREVASGEMALLTISSLEEPTRSSAPAARESALEEMSEEAWAQAEYRLKVLEPLLSARPGRSRQDYADVAAQANVSVSTIYRWMKDYTATGLVSSLLPTRRAGGRGRSRLSAEVKLIVDHYIQNHHLTLQKPSVTESTREIRRLCDSARLSPLPSETTVRRHLDWIDEQERVKRREGAHQARQRFAVNKGSIPDTDWPLAMVQMDHTLLPVIIVDDEHRKPINRAWITLTIDVNSRVCLGMYLSLDPPSAMSAGMCVSHAILTKEAWMARMGYADIEWPFYGVMDVLHMDNAREFRGRMLLSAGKEYHIDIHLRPVKQPHYGAHIERLMGTVSQELKAVKGATFCGPAEKGEYDAEGNACMTFDELEKWLVLMFARYHRDLHSGIGTTPLTKWREGILGTNKQPGRGLPPRRTDEERVRLDFMPYEERTVQDYGVVIDNVHYFHDVLRPWVNARDPKYPKHSRKFRFRYDPRDISTLYFFDPDIQRYFPIPYRDTGLPPVSIWELRAAQKKAEEIGIDVYSEREVFSLITRQREIEDAAAAKTKTARRAKQQRSQQAKARETKKTDLPTVSVVAPSTTAPALRGYDPDKIRPLDDDE